MLEILKFIFSSFWIWLGTFLLIIAVAELFPLFTINKIVKKSKKVKDEYPFNVKPQKRVEDNEIPKDLRDKLYE